MPAKSGPGVEWHVAKRFGLGGLYDFPDVDIHLAKYHLELVDQRNIHGAENILRELYGFGGFGRAYRDGNVNDCAIELLHQARMQGPRHPPQPWEYLMCEIRRCPDLRVPGRIREKNPVPNEARLLPEGASEIPLSCRGKMSIQV